MFEQKDDDLLVALERHTAERSLPAIIPAIHFRAVFEQHPRAFNVSVVTRKHEQRVAFGVSEIHGQSVTKHRGKQFSFVRAGVVQRPCLQLGVTFFLRFGDDGLHRAIPYWTPPAMVGADSGALGTT